MIDPESIRVGQCYVTYSGQVRRVRAIADDRVLFDNRKRAPKGPRWIWFPGILDPKTFAAMIERPVSCDWTPETDEC